MKGLLILILVIAGSVIAGIYGALYDQLTFTISPEFFTKYRFMQTHFDFIRGFNPRMGAAIMGFYNTWKTGLFLSIVLSSVGLISKDNKLMVKTTIKSFLITLAIAFIVGLIGWAVSPLEAQAGPDASLNIQDVNAFETVDNMNYFSYAGAFIGMFLGIFYQIYIHNQYKIKTLEKELKNK